MPLSQDFTIDFFAGDRSVLRPLFALADDSAARIDAYQGKGDVLVARAGERIVGHAQIIGHELNSLAVHEDCRRRGIGARLVAAAVERCREQGATSLLVATAAADTGNLRFYQRQGFRMERIVQDAFGPEQSYPSGLTIDGIPLRDQVVLRRAIG